MFGCPALCLRRKEVVRLLPSISGAYRSGLGGFAWLARWEENGEKVQWTSD